MKSVAQHPQTPTIIGEYFGEHHKVRHVLWLPDFRDPGAYRQGMSFDGFTRRMLHRKDKHISRWFYVKHISDWFMDVDSQVRLTRQYPEFAATPNVGAEFIPTVVHDDLLSFYEKIGYDRDKNTLSPDFRVYEGAQDRHPVFHELLALRRK